MDTEKHRQHRSDNARLSASADIRSKQLLVIPTELLLTNRKWLPGTALEWIGTSNTWLVCRYEYQTCSSCCTM